MNTEELEKIVYIDCVMIDIFNIYDYKTEVIAASIRPPLHVIESAKIV